MSPVILVFGTVFRVWSEINLVLELSSEAAAVRGLDLFAHGAR